MTLYKKKRIALNPAELQNFVDSETGESLSSKLMSEDIEMRLIKKTEDITIKWENFTIVNDDMTAYLINNLSAPELGYLYIMMQDLKTNSNIIFNHNIPHINDTLQKKLGFSSQSMFFKLIKKLQELEIIHQSKARVSGSIRRIYIFNPHIARKRKSINKETMDIFESFYEKFKEKKK